MSTGQARAIGALTHRDLDHTPEDGNTYEVIDGALFVTPFATTRHQNAAGELFAILRNHVRANDLGKVYAAGLKVVLDEPTGVGPDVVYIAKARLDGLREDGFHGAPDLVVEVLSSKPYLDRMVKKDRYARAGIPHYWIVDAAARTLEAYRLDGGRFHLVGEWKDEVGFTPELFPGLTIELRDLWV